VGTWAFQTHFELILLIEISDGLQGMKEKFSLILGPFKEARR
jgi:hypothetical protein